MSLILRLNDVNQQFSVRSQCLIYNSQRQMSQYKNFQHLGFLSQRAVSSKVNSSSPVPKNGHHNSYQKQGVQQNKFRKADEEINEIDTIHKENQVLKQQNKLLKKELNFYRTEAMVKKSSSAGKQQVNDLRETIKKEAGQIKDLKTRLELLSKQCRMYQDIIDKMESKIDKLIQQNQNMKSQLKICEETYQKKNQESYSHNLKYKGEDHQSELETVTQRLSELTHQFYKTESNFKSEYKDWEKWKQQKQRQSSYYLHRIQDLEGMLGIGKNSTDYSKQKKRY